MAAAVGTPPFAARLTGCAREARQRRAMRPRPLLMAAVLLLLRPWGALAGSLEPPRVDREGSRRELSQVAAPSQPGQPDYATGRVIVSFKPDVVAAMAAEQTGLAFQAPAGLLGAAVYTIVDGQDVSQKIQELQKHPAVAVVEPDYKVRVFARPDDPNYSLQWHHPIISSERAWNVSTGNNTVKVCHVDSGVRVDHADLAGNVLKGWNMVPAGQNPGDPPPRAGTPEYFNYNDTYGHGTHTAGIIGAIGNNRVGVVGLNWNTRLLVCRFIWNDGTGFVSDAMNCVKLCRQEGALITSNSWGGIGYSSFLEREIAAAQSGGQLFVVASGNMGVDLDQVPLYPASYKTDNMISVGSSGKNDYVSTFSNVGLTTVHMVAPGEAIYSTGYDGSYVTMYGTSMACPMVAGAAALLQAAALSRGVTLPYADLKSLILSSVDKVSDASDKTSTGGRLNVTGAMQALNTMLNGRGIPQAPGPASPAPSPKPSPPPPKPSPSPSPPPPKASPPPPAGTDKGIGSVVCGTSALRGLNSAVQSSTAGGNGANQAIDGECGKRRISQSSCSQTKEEANPWWAVKMPTRRPVLGVSIQTSSQCACTVDLVDAKIFVGNSPWTSSASAANFSLCANVSGIVRGQRKTFACAKTRAGSPLQGQYIAIWRPGPAKKSITLCEVDVLLGTPPPPAPKSRRKSGLRKLHSASQTPIAAGPGFGAFGAQPAWEMEDEMQ